MANEVEIRVRVDDDTGRGASKVRTSMRSMFQRLGSDAEGEGGNVAQKFGGRFLGMLKDTVAVGSKPIAVTAATAFSSQFVGAVASGLASGAAKVAHGGAAMLALLPAVATAGVLAMGAIKIAVLGVADALEAGLAGDTEKFNEALEGMAPAARNVMRDIVGLKDRLDDLKSSVQQAMFAPLVNSVRPLADAYLPTVQTVLSDIAGTFGQVGNSVGSFLALPSTTMSLAGAMFNARDAVVNVASGVGSLVQAFLPLITVGSTFLPQLSDGFGGATARLASFMQEAERTGELAAFIQGGLDKLRALWTTGEQVVRILKDVGAIGKMVFAGIGLESGGLLDTIEGLVGRLRDFFETSEGGQVLKQILAALGGLASSAMGTIQKVAGMIAPFLPQIVAFATAFNELKTAILDAIEPAVQVIGGLLLPALTSVMEWLSNNGPVLQGILIGLFTAWAIHAGMAAAATLAATWPFIAIGVAIAALAALIIIHWETIKAAGVAVWHFLYAAASMVIGAVTAIVNGFWLFIQGVWNVITIAGVAVWHAIYAVVSFVIGAITGIIHGLWLAIQGVWNAITFAGVAVWHAIYGAAAWVRDRIVDAATWVRDVVTGAFDWVRDRVVGVWDAIWDKVAWVRDSIGDAVDWVKDKLAGIAEAISDLPGAGVVRGIAGAFGFAHGGIAGAAAGGLRSGLHLVGERGAELVNLRAGSRVIPNNEMGRALGGTGGGGGITVNIYPQGSILAERDLVKIINDAILHGDMRDALTRATAGV